MSSLTFFTDPERYRIELSLGLLNMNVAEGYTGGFLDVKNGHFRGGDVESFLSNLGETFMAISRPKKAEGR